MKLVVPHMGELRAADARLMRLAQFLGIDCELLPLDKQTREHGMYLEKAMPAPDCCFLFNPLVMREWVGADLFPAELASYLISRIPRLLVHGVTLDPFMGSMITSLSEGRLASVHPIEDAGQPYEIAARSQHICGPFAGLSFGRTNPANDRVFGVKAGSQTVRNLICIGGRPFMAALRLDRTEIICLASEDVTDINAHAGYAPLDDHFSQFIPHAMALRYIFGEECWRPEDPTGCVIVDDPLLRPSYGFLNFDFLLKIMKEHRFHTSIAFIPYNYRRNSKRIVRLFVENADYLSICYHGNDHTASEFASCDVDFLQAALAIAEERMRLHHQTSGLNCSKVMVFPQSDYSVEAMQVLKSRNFYGAVTSAWHPLGQLVLPSLADFCQPAVVRFGGFPSFGRNSARCLRSQDVAFNVFFGKPVLTGEHHDTFEKPNDLTEGVERVNAVAPGITWSNLETVTKRSFLRRRAVDGTLEIRPFAPSVAIGNHSDSVERYCIRWDGPGEFSRPAQVFRDEVLLTEAEVNDVGIRVSAELPPGACQTFSAVCRNAYPTPHSLGLRWGAKAFLRRRLSEVRDNYLFKNPRLLTLAKSLKRCLMS